MGIDFTFQVCSRVFDLELEKFITNAKFYYLNGSFVREFGKASMSIASCLDVFHSVHSIFAGIKASDKIYEHHILHPYKPALNLAMLVLLIRCQNFIKKPSSVQTKQVKNNDPQLNCNIQVGNS